MLLGLLGIVSIFDIRLRILKSVFPLSLSQYWFATVYIIVLLMKPVINEVINNDLKHSLIIYSALLCIYCVSRYTVSNYLGIFNGVVFYWIGALIKKFEKRFRHHYLYLFLGIICWLGYAFFTNVGSIGLFGLFQGVSSIIGVCILGTISATLFFLFAMSGSYFNHHMINRLAESVFSVYLLHENPMFREVLWSKVLNVETYQYTSNIFFIYAIISIVSVFIICIIIDNIKKLYIDTALDKFIRNINLSLLTDD